MATPLIQYQTSLSANTVLLCRFLRNKGFSISATEEADALLAISHLPIHKEAYFKDGLKSTLAKNTYQWLHFDELYLEFKIQLAKASDSKIKDREVPKDKPSESRKKAAQFESLKDWLNLNPSEEVKEVATFSSLEVLAKRDFANLSEDEMRLITSVLKKMARRLAHQKSRLKKNSKQQKRLDLKKTIRANMRWGGEIQRLEFTENKDRKLKLVLLCDVSRSMDLYSRFFVHLIYAFHSAYDKIETFVFSTALHRVTEILENHEFDKAFELISDRVPQWSGGTTIGSCLADFAENYGYSHLDRRTNVLILSDGWDTGEPEIMKEAMRTIHKRSKKVIWLNPLAGSPGFSPEAIGMKTALPYIDALASAHNLESLKNALYQLQKRRNLIKT